MKRVLPLLLFLSLALPSSGRAASGPPALPASRLELSASERISANDLQKLIDSGKPLVIFDARGKEDFERAHIRGAVLPLPLAYYNDMALYRARILPDWPDPHPYLKDAMQKYPDKSIAIVTYCNVHCKASAVLLHDLKDLGYSNVRAMDEGLQMWAAKGFPVETGGKK